MKNYMGLGVAIGVGVGKAFGVATHHIATWAASGAAFGIGVGLILNQRIGN